MSKKYDGDKPAFPCGYIGDVKCPGATVRELYIGMALQGLLASGAYKDNSQKAGEAAINAADAAIKAMAKL